MTAQTAPSDRRGRDMNDERYGPPDTDEEEGGMTLNADPIHDGDDWLDEYQQSSNNKGDRK